MSDCNPHSHLLVFQDELISMTDVIFRGVPSDDMILAVRAMRWLQERPDNNDAILIYGEGTNQKTFYVVRRKASIIVRPA